MFEDLHFICQWFLFLHFLIIWVWIVSFIIYLLLLLLSFNFTLFRFLLSFNFKFSLLFFTQFFTGIFCRIIRLFFVWLSSLNFLLNFEFIYGTIDTFTGLLLQLLFNFSFVFFTHFLSDSNIIIHFHSTKSGNNINFIFFLLTVFVSIFLEDF